jgi:hypothetical protein
MAFLHGMSSCTLKTHTLTICCFPGQQEVKAENLKLEHTKGKDADDGDGTLPMSRHEGSLDEDLEMGTSSNPDQNEAAKSSSDAPPLHLKAAKTVLVF